jgi:xanthine dehydrogenase accessory factor
MSSAGVGGQRAVIETAQTLREAGRAFALVIVVRTEGSTYRKAGALAVVADGVHVGVISGGCLESGVELLARDALRADAPALAVFDTRGDDDLVFGSGSGCRGRMQVLAIPATSEAGRRHVDAIIDAGRERHALTIATDELAPGVLTSGEVTIRPPPQVLMLGAGPEARPLLTIGRTLGWYCCVGDHRQAQLATERIGRADRLLPLRPAAALHELAGERIDAVLVMSHMADADLEALRALAGSDIPYVGLLGPAGRRDELLARLSAMDREALKGRLHAPVGLPLGGEGPEVIALSIAAELQQAGIGA